MAAFAMISKLRHCIFSFEEACSVALGLRLPPRAPLGAISVIARDGTTTSLVPEKDLGFLWAVPKNRRTIERRWKRKFGSPKYGLKIFTPKQNLLVCNTCGHFHEAKVLCGHCYAKVVEETKAAQQAVQDKLGLSAIDKDIILLYDGEPQPTEQPNKLVIEVRRPRPQWFSKNLLQRSTDVPSPTAVSTEMEAQPIKVKPSDLG